MDICIIDDHPCITDGMGFLLDQLDAFKVLGVANTVAEGLELAKAHQPDGVLLDVEMGGITGPEAAKGIQALSKHTIIMAFSGHCSLHHVRLMLQAGARGYVAKDCDLNTIKDAFLTASNHQIYLCDTTQKTMERAGRTLSELLEAPTLSELELNILEATGSGRSLKATAKELGITAKAVENHRYRLFKKLDCKNAAELCAFAHAHGLLAKAPVA